MCSQSIEASWLLSRSHVALKVESPRPWNSYGNTEGFEGVTSGELDSLLLVLYRLSLRGYICEPLTNDNLSSWLTRQPFNTNARGLVSASEEINV